jgi:DNA-binding beta-propeller fold protein YncE
MADLEQQAAEQPKARASVPARRPRPAARPGKGYLFGASLVIGISLVCIGVFTLLLSSSKGDPGVRVWLLNHAPDQIGIINPYDGVAEKKLTVADGLRGLNFSRDGTKAFVQNVVDVTNKLTVIDTSTYIKDDVIEVDGVPQGVGVFPDNRKLAVILGSRTEFMAGGFDVLDLKAQTKADPTKKKVLMHVRDLRLAHKIQVGDDGDRVYMIDAKSSKLAVYSFSQQKQLRTVELGGACEDFIYPRYGKYYFAGVLEHLTIYQIDKESDEIVGGYIYSDMDPEHPYWRPWLRRMAVDPTGHYLYATATERKAVAVWDINNRTYMVQASQFHGQPGGDGYPAFGRIPFYLPMNRFTLNGGYLQQGMTDIPGPQLIATDPLNEYVYVVDERGALYIFNRKDVEVAHPPSYFPTAPMSTPEPHRIAADMASDTTEVRDIAVSLPMEHHVVGGALSAAAGGGT